jgi:H+/Na+-translocating ferredoxin:NAD+ oxidoreductase subunit G
MSTLAAMRDRLSYQGISLGVVALITSAALVIANSVTHGKIAEAEKRDLKISLAQVLPEGIADNDLLADTISIAGRDGNPVTVYRARKAGAVTAAVFKMAARGYAGDVVVLIGVDANGRMLGARVVKHNETPGLGDKVDIAKTKWILAFNGKSLGDPPPDKWAVKKDGGIFDQFAGATITPRAVVKAVKTGLEFYADHKGEILSGAKP